MRPNCLQLFSAFIPLLVGIVALGSAAELIGLPLWLVKPAPQSRCPGLSTCFRKGIGFGHHECHRQKGISDLKKEGNMIRKYSIVLSMLIFAVSLTQAYDQGVSQERHSRTEYFIVPENGIVMLGLHLCRLLWDAQDPGRLHQGVE